MEDIKTISEQVKLDVVPYESWKGNKQYDIDYILYDLDSQLDLQTSKADTADYIVAVASGILCGLLDALWVGDFDLASGRNIASDKVDSFVISTAKMLGGKKTSNITQAVSYLEKYAPLASDGNASDFGGGLQHHLRDFAHHPTMFGLMCSLLTQFTGKSFGTNVNGEFMTVDVPETHMKYIGNTVGEKICNGTISWFIHLVSDVAGSKSSAGKGGGTGIPGPILSLAKEMSAIPLFKDFKVADTELSVYLSKLFNGTALAAHDENGKIIKESVLKVDLRGELGANIELGKQSLPVLANEVIVRTFYFIRRLIVEMRRNKVSTLEDMLKIDMEGIFPKNNPTLTRMLTVAAGVFTTVDIVSAAVSESYVVAVNYVGVGRFAVTVGEEIGYGLSRRNVKKIKEMYENIERNTFRDTDNRIYERIGADMDFNTDKLGLTIEQTEILYNIEQYKIINDINATTLKSEKALKSEWFTEWKRHMADGFASFTQVEGAQLNWLTREQLDAKIDSEEPQKPWYRLVLLEAMLFEPYYALSLELDKKGNQVASKKYNSLGLPGKGYWKSEGDRFLNSEFTGKYCQKDYITRLRKCYDKCLRELNEVLKKVITTMSITAAVALVTVATAGALAPTIAVALVGSNFAGLSGAALTSACLAYLGGGAVAIGGAGMTGGTIAIVGGGAVLGLGVGAGVGGAVGAAGIAGKKQTIMQSAKLLVSVREIFLNDEHDVEFSNSVYEKYLENITEIEKGLVELRLKADTATGDEKKRLNTEIKRAEESVEAMKIARKSMLRFQSSFETGVETQQ